MANLRTSTSSEKVTPLRIQKYVDAELAQLSDSEPSTISDNSSNPSEYLPDSDSTTMDRLGPQCPSHSPTSTTSQVSCPLPN